MKILVFGNMLVEEDSLPLRLMPKLEKLFPSIEFKEFDTAENLEDEGRDLVILDTAFGIEKVTLIDDVDNLQLSKTASMHDFDLPITLRILIKLKAIDSVKIIAIPAGYEEKKAIEEISEMIKSIST
jgi:Ni,Fe-hydrogenase maturation factor